MVEDRDTCIDMLRSIVIVNAIILHFDTKFDISFLAYPFKFAQNCMFTVGGFFFFTAGVMACDVYVVKYRDNYWSMTKKLILKGLKIHSIYIFYLLILKTAIGIEIEGSIIGFLFYHKLFLKVLFTFGTLYICAPLFLFIISMNKNTIYYLIFLNIFAYFVLDFIFIEESILKILLIDRRQFLYPLIPSLLMFFLGILYSTIMDNSDIKNSITNPVGIRVLLTISGSIIVFTFFSKVYFTQSYFNDAFITTIREFIVIVTAILWTKFWFNTSPKIKNRISQFKGLCFGIKSLTAYVSGNILIGLINVTLNPFEIKILMLFVVLWLTYLVTYWNWKSVAIHKHAAFNQ